MLRTVLGDGVTDHYEFKADVTPTPDGLHTRFFGGRVRMLEESVQVFVNGVNFEAANLDSMDPVRGVVVFPTAPTGAVQLSFHWQWFTDQELNSFITDGLGMLGYSDITDTTIDIALRSVVLDLASSLAYTRKAAEYAESLQASSPDGYSVDTGKAHPNWAALAKDAMKRAQDKFKWIIDNPFGQASPSMRMTSFRLSSYQPRS